MQLDSVEFVDCGTAMEVAVLSDTVALSNSTISSGSDGVTVYGHGELPGWVLLNLCTFENQTNTGVLLNKAQVAEMDVLC